MSGSQSVSRLPRPSLPTDKDAILSVLAFIGFATGRIEPSVNQRAACVELRACSSLAATADLLQRGLHRCSYAIKE